MPERVIARVIDFTLLRDQRSFITEGGWVGKLFFWGGDHIVFIENGGARIQSTPKKYRGGTDF